MNRIGRRRRGLTIVELVITLALIALLTTLMIPSIGNWLSHYRIKGVARTITSYFRLAQMTAVQKNQTCRVEFNTNVGRVQVLDSNGVAMRAIELSEYKARFNGLDFMDVGGDGLVGVEFNTRGIPRDEAGNPLTPPGGQNGQRVFLINNRGEGYWVEITPVGNVRYDRV